MKFTIYGNPRTKKNSMQIVYNGRRPMIIPSKEYKDFEKNAEWAFRNVAHEPIDYPVTVKCVYYRDSRRRCDLVNLLEATDDILVRYGVLKDDKFEIIASHDGSRVYVDREEPRTEITITEFNDDNI